MKNSLRIAVAAVVAAIALAATAAPSQANYWEPDAGPANFWDLD
jgi:hypothetical protein